MAMLRKLKEKNKFLDLSDISITVSTQTDCTKVNFPTTESKTEYNERNATNDKGAISTLNELNPQRLTPKYELVETGGLPHAPTFKYQVTVGELVTTGVGSSKKMAKEEAAMVMLQKIKETDDYIGPLRR